MDSYINACIFWLKERQCTSLFLGSNLTITSSSDCGRKVDYPYAVYAENDCDVIAMDGKSANEENEVPTSLSCSSHI